MAGLATITLSTSSVRAEETTAQSSYPLKSENAIPLGDFSAYLSCAEMAVPHTTMRNVAVVTIATATLQHGAQVKAQLLHRRPAEEPVAVVDLVDTQAGLEHQRVRDHRIVMRVGVFRDVEILLQFARGVREKRPEGTDACAEFIRLE